MNDHRFEEIITAERNRSIPVCPTNLEANVLRRVRVDSGYAEEIGWVDWIFGLLPQKRVAFGFLTLSLLFSIVSTMVATSTSLHAAETRSRAVSALDFGVFKETLFLKLED